MSPKHKQLAVLHGEMKTPPMGKEARIRAGYLLRLLQRGDNLSMPDSRPMPSIGPRCHELRVEDGGVTWRIIYRVDPDAVVIADVFKKKKQQTPKGVIDTCRRRLRHYGEG